jgi:hypothetical protein
MQRHSDTTNTIVTTILGAKLDPVSCLSLAINLLGLASIFNYNTMACSLPRRN